MTKYSVGIFVWMAIALAHISTAHAVSTSWDSDFGELVLNVNDDGTIEGHYPKYSGTLTGKIEEDGRLVSIWNQPTAKQRCDTPKNNQYYWGTVHWALAEGRYLIGYWTYCDNPDTGGSWNAYQPSAADMFADLLGTLLSAAGQVAGSQIGGHAIVQQLAGHAIDRATNATTDMLDASGTVEGMVAIASTPSDTLAQLKALAEPQLAETCAHRTSRHKPSFDSRNCR